MPELPEVEHLRRTLAQRLAGRRVARATLHRRDVCDDIDGRQAAPADLLSGGRFVEPIRHGKQLGLVVADGRALRVHLGMTGQMFVAGERGNRTHVHAEWTLDDGSTLIFRDPRRFGGLVPYATVGHLRQRWSDLGPDALSIRAGRLSESLRGTSRSIKAVLLDQDVVAGIGNIYADEALFRAAIHPRQCARGLTGEDIDRLSVAIRCTLAGAIKGGGSTLRDYVDANGRAGRHQLAHLVYGRAGQPCVTCRSPLRTAVVAQRTTVFCTTCQNPRDTRKLVVFHKDRRFSVRPRSQG